MRWEQRQQEKALARYKRWEAELALASDTQTDYNTIAVLRRKLDGAKARYDHWSSVVRLEREKRRGISGDTQRTD